LGKPIYLTTPIYYVNGKPHIGQAYTTIAADLLKRFYTMNGREAYFLTGTDEHGTKIAEAAEKAGVKPQEFCDDIVGEFKKAWKNLDIINDDFIRTTEQRHIDSFSHLISVLKDKKTDDGQDVIYNATYEGLYCTGCEKFITEKELVDGLCPDHKKAPTVTKENNYFFRLSSFKNEIKELIESNKLKIGPDERRREVLGLFEQDIPDFSLSRERVKWGIELPFDKSQVAYVWIDALSNYITAIGYNKDDEKFKKWWHDSETIHLIGKDILKFHCIFWPAILLAAGLPLPSQIFIHGYFTIDGQKMSKSLGNFIDPNELVEEFGVDTTRYLLLTQYPFGADGDVKRAEFITKYNSDLANDLGNLISRVSKMIVANYDGKLPGPAENIKIDELTEESEKKTMEYIDSMNSLAISKGIEGAISLVRYANKFFANNEPWKLIKDDKLAEAGGVLYACAETIRIVCTMLYPVMPTKMLEALSVFGLGEKDLSIDNARTFYYLQPGAVIKIDQPVFPRMQKKKPDIKQAKSKSDGDADGLIDISDFGKVKLVVAEVISAEKVEGADKLLKLQIDIGAEKRQVIAGIAQHYTPEEIIGKRVVAVKNLKPAVIRGVESHGMLLAAKKGKKLVIVTPDGDIPTGAGIS